MTKKLSESKALALLLIQAKAIAENKFKQNTHATNGEKTLTAELINLTNERIQNLKNNDNPLDDELYIKDRYDSWEKSLNQEDACSSLRGLHYMLQDTVSDEDRIRQCIEQLFIIVSDCIGNNGQNVYDAADTLNKLAYAGIE